MNGTLLHTAQVAAIYRVDPKTVTRWADAGLIPGTRTAGRHRRFRETDMPAGPGELMTGPEVAAAFNVCPYTVTRWAQDGKIPAITVPGGRRRYRRSDVAALLHPGGAAGKEAA